MKSTELRIGNIVTDEFYESTKTIIEVESIDERGINLEIEDDGNYPECAQNWIEPYYRFDVLRPIPLTEEWLIKFGFIEEEINNFVLRDNNIIFTIHRNLVTGEFMWGRQINYSRLIKSLHHLQNLYFTLVGSEIETKG